MEIQAYLTAAAINLKRLAASIVALLWVLADVLFGLLACAGRMRQNTLVLSAVRRGFFNSPAIQT